MVKSCEATFKTQVSFKPLKKTTIRDCFFGLLAFLVLATGLFSIIPNTIFSLSSSLQDFESFTETVMEMQRTYATEDIILSEDQYEIDGEEVLVSATVAASLSFLGDDAGEGLVSVAYTTTDDGEISVATSTMRLIVNSEEKADSHGAVMTARYENWQIFQYETLEDAESAFEALASEGFDPSYDEIVTLDYTVDETSDDGYEEVSATSSTALSWGADFVGYSDYVANIYSKHTSDELDYTVYVAVLDSGIYAEHQTFYVGETEAGRIATDYATNFDTTDYPNASDPHYTDYTMYGSTDGYYEYRDYCGHGTHVSGTIVESTPDNVLIIPVKILNYEGSGYTSSIIEAIEYITDLRENDGLNIVVANLSVGVSTTSSTSTTSKKIKTAIEAAYDAGIICVVSAGNSSTSTEYASPANVSTAFTVSALKKSTSGSVTFDSSYSNYGTHVDFSAPGSSIVSAGISSVKSTATMSGTSMAAPHVTTAVALIFCEPAFKNYSGDEVLKLLSDNAVDLGDEGWDQYYGYGMIYIGGIGVEYETGYVSFSVASGEYTEAFDLTLSFDLPSDALSYVIYYTTDENISAYDGSDSWILYSDPITISDTTRVTAIAITTYSGGTTKQTYSANAEYTFGTTDFLTNYTFTLLSDGTYEITAYSGTFTKLTLPSEYNDTAISTLGSYFLQGTVVTTLYVPDSITTIDTYAFRANTKITEISFYDADEDGGSATAATSLTIGNHAFFNCTNLTTLDFGGQDEVITTIGSHAFAYVPGLSELKLKSVTTIGKHAFSYTSLSTLWLGLDFQSIESQTNFTVGMLYGYSDNAATVSLVDSLTGTTFQDLCVTWVDDLSSFYVASTNSEITLTVTYSGYGVEFDGIWVGYYGNDCPVGYTVKNSSTENEDGSVTVTSTFSSLKVNGMGGFPGMNSSSSGTIYIWGQVTDYMGNSITSTVMELTVTSSSNICTLTITSEDSDTLGEGNCVVYINDSEVSGTVSLLKNTTYSIYVEAESGFKVTSVLVDSSQKMSDSELSAESTGISFTQKFTDTTASLAVETAYKDYFTVTFNTTYSGVEHASIIISGSAISGTSCEVKRGNSLSFQIDSDTGYNVSKVMANGEVIVAVDEVYTIDSVTEDITIDIEYDVQTNSVSLVYGKDCGTVDWSGSSDLAVGESKTYTVTASDGYALDTVTLDSEEVEIVVQSNGVYCFTITNSGTSDSDLVVEISFKKDNGLGEVLAYFIIFCAIFVVFVIASVILGIVRKKQKEKDELEKR